MSYLLFNLLNLHTLGIYSHMVWQPQLCKKSLKGQQGCFMMQCLQNEGCQFAHFTGEGEASKRAFYAKENSPIVS